MSGFDVVREVVPGQRAVALRNVAQTAGVFDTHFPRRPVLPGVLLLDDLTAVARLAADDAGETGAVGAPSGGWVLRRLSRVRFRHFVSPGDQVELSAQRVDVNDADANGERVFRVRASVGGRVVTAVDRLVLAPAAPAEPAAEVRIVDLTQGREVVVS